MTTAFPYTVLQVVPNLDTGGVEQTVLDMANAITQAGGRAIVVSQGGRLEPALKETGAVFHRLPVHSKNPYVQFKNYYALQALIKREKVDIVHVRSRAPALAAIAAARASGIKSVTTYHGIYNAKSKLKRWYNGLMTQADVTIANSDYTRAHILNTYPVEAARVISIPRGVDLKRFDPAQVSDARKAALAQAWGLKADDERPLFVLAGRLTRWKGQGLILEAFARLKDVPWRLVLAGDDQGRHEYRAELENLIVQNGFSERVFLAGHCADMPAAYALSDFALAPSLEPEAFGRTAVEPQAMQKPVLASAHGATTETVEDGVTGWLVTPADVTKWSEALRLALETPQSVRDEMGALGRQRAEARFSLEVMCARTLEVYRSLMATT
ncbi:MAG: glycosyltransferase family 4 protein [Asticcacaulis sp.]